MAALQGLAWTASVALAVAACTVDAPEEPIASESPSSSADPGGPPPALPPGACAHPGCLVGPPLAFGPDPIVTSVCAADPYCCSASGFWDGICVSEFGALSPAGACPASFVMPSWLNPTQCLDVPGASSVPGTGLQEWSCNGLPNQRFAFNNLGDCSYTIVAQHDGECLSAGAFGAQVKQQTCTGGTEQRFDLLSVAGGFAFKARSNGLCMNIFGGVPAPAVPIVEWWCDLAPNELFLLIP